MTSVPLAGNAKAEPVRQRPALETLRKLWPYMWPPDRPDLKRRVVVALRDPGRRQDHHGARPLHLQMGDRRAGRSRRHRRRRSRPRARASLTVPIMLVVANGVGRILMNVFNNLRDALFAKVGQHAVRTARLQDLRAHARAVAPLSPAAADRRPVAHHRARRQRHRDDRPLHHPQHACRRSSNSSFAAAIIAYQFDWQLSRSSSRSPSSSTSGSR